MLPGMGGAIAGRAQLTSKMIDVLTGLGVTTNLKLCLDAGDAASYTSGQSWLDRSGGGYDFYRGSGSGSDSADPTFNGTAGGRSASEYWSFDGGDYLTYDAANETWMNALHKESAVFTACFWVKLVSGGTNGLFGTIDSSGTDTGIGLFVRPPVFRTLRMEAHNGGANVLNFETSATVNFGVWNFLAVSLDETTGAAVMHLNGATETFSGKTYSSPSSGAATRTMQIGAYGNGVGALQSGSLMADAAMWQGTALSAANLASIFAATRRKFGV